MTLDEWDLPFAAAPQRETDMLTFIALLRAVNVGGTGVFAMSDLKLLCEHLGFTGVRTYIQSGNVVFGAAGTEASVKAALEAALATKREKHTDVLVRSADELAAVLDRNPFPLAPGNQVSVLFFDHAPDDTVLAAVTIPGREKIRQSGREVYVHYPQGIGQSKLKLSRLGTATARNINTIAKLVAMTRN